MSYDCQKEEEPGLGRCCCNCEHQVLVYKHPWNANDARGRITELYGMLCTSPEVKDQTRKSGIFFNGEHGMCEVHEQRKETK